ncbi:hypothetical protein CANARDRAFT_30072 [[Candida] arabinofermentans NRRL YB-2248]|uniref:Uncharacterized protein n=1 Tax=[Candida] arabinofermentans NRRL YB-2248 TaxID=983967 RepID=A0A1E4SUX2_9ASCO|nr:hypothetical protein CANARDRAFT_30072 [[Candida] arabinofermentans NRRL YB-2248]
MISSCSDSTQYFGNANAHCQPMSSPVPNSFQTVSNTNSKKRGASVFGDDGEQQSMSNLNESYTVIQAQQQQHLKKHQFHKITSEIHERTISIMMQASKELYLRELLQQQLSLDYDMSDDSVSGSYKENGSSQSHEQLRDTAYRQRPYWL